MTFQYFEEKHLEFYRVIDLLDYDFHTSGKNNTYQDIERIYII